MIPYFEIPALAGIIHSFGVLVAIGILVGARLVRVRAKQIGLDDLAASSVATWVVVGGFIVGHLFDVVAYQPQVWSGFRLDWEHLKPIVNPASGLSSFGGFLGALIGLLSWARHYRQPILPFADSLMFGLAAGWTFGRLGCFSAHDHPGRLTDFFLAVKFPGGARHDLGLYEAIFAASLTGLFLWLYRKPRRIGTYVALGCVLYAPVRFGLDFLRAVDVSGADPRYFGLTPAQYGAVLLLLCGLVLAWRASGSGTHVDGKPLLWRYTHGQLGDVNDGGDAGAAGHRDQKQSERG